MGTKNPDYPEDLLGYNRLQAREANSFIDPEAERELIRFLADSHGDVPPLELLESVNLVDQKQQGKFAGYDDPLAPSWPDSTGRS